ncbi:MAG: MFS transporter [Thermodesulfovibrionales bacterium]
MESNADRESARTIALFSAAHVVDDIYMNMLPPLLPVLIAQYRLSYAAAGLIVTVFTITSSVSQPFIGYVIDRYRLAWTSSAGLIWVGLWMGLVGLAGSYPVLLGAAALAGLGPAMFHPHALASISRIRTGGKGRVMSFFLIGGNLGFALGPALAGLLTGAGGIRGITLIAIPGILMGFVLHRAARDSGYDQTGHTEHFRLADFSPAVVLTIVVVLRSWVYFSVLSYLPSWLVHAGTSVLASNAHLTMMLLAGVAGQFAGGSLSDHYGRKQVAMASLLCAAPLLLLFLHAQGAAALALLFLFGFTVMASFSITIVMVHEIMHRHVGTASGIMIGFAVGVGGLGVLVSGFVADAAGIGASLHLLVGLLVLAGILTHFIPYRQVTSDVQSQPQGDRPAAS